VSCRAAGSIYEWRTRRHGPPDHGAFARDKRRRPGARCTIRIRGTGPGAARANDRERDQWISRYIDERGGSADDAACDALHAQAQATREYAQFVDAVRREILEYLGVADNQLDWVVLLRNDDSDELWAEVNRRRSVLGAGEVRGYL
jgi:hypothetical protein